MGLPIQEDIFCGGKAGDQGKLLVYHADARRQRVKGGIKGHFFAVNEDVAAVAAGLPDDIHTEENLHQRGLACAVLTTQAQDLSRAQGEIDIGEDLVSEKILFDSPHFQQRSS